MLYRWPDTLHIKRVFKQWSTIPPILTKLKTHQGSSHLKLLYTIYNQGPGLGQAQKGGSVKLVNGIPPSVRLKQTPKFIWMSSCKRTFIPPCVYSGQTLFNSDYCM